MINHFVVFLISNDAPYHQLAYVLAPPGTTRNQYHDKHDVTMINIHIMYIYTYTWNLFVLYFVKWTLQNKVFFNPSKAHLGSRYIYIYCHSKEDLIIHPSKPCPHRKHWCSDGKSPWPLPKCPSESLHWNMAYVSKLGPSLRVFWTKPVDFRIVDVIFLRCSTFTPRKTNMEQKKSL